MMMIIIYNDCADDGYGDDVLSVPLRQVETAFASFLLYGMMLTHYHLIIIIMIIIINDHNFTSHTYTQIHYVYHHHFLPIHVLLNNLLS